MRQYFKVSLNPDEIKKTGKFFNGNPVYYEVIFPEITERRVHASGSVITSTLDEEVYESYLRKARAVIVQDFLQQRENAAHDRLPSYVFHNVLGGYVPSDPDPEHFLLIEPWTSDERSVRVLFASSLGARMKGWDALKTSTTYHETLSDLIATLERQIVTLKEEADDLCKYIGEQATEKGLNDRTFLSDFSVWTVDPETNKAHVVTRLAQKI